MDRQWFRIEIQFDSWREECDYDLSDMIDRYYNITFDFRTRDYPNSLRLYGIMIDEY